MDFGDHFRVTGGALKNWFVAQLQDSLAVGLLWLIWPAHSQSARRSVVGIAGRAFQFVPQIGAVLGVIGPALTAMFKWGDWEHPLYVLMLYAVIAIVDGFLLQPYIMKRTARVPIWASILAPDCPGDDHSVLGCAAGSAVTGGTLCVQGSTSPACRIPCYNFCSPAFI